MHGLTDNLEIRYVNDPVAAANNTDDNSTIIDMADYESVTFITSVEGSVSGGVAALTVEGNDANQDAGMAAISGAVATKTSAGSNDIKGKSLVVEVRNPAKRFLQAVITSTTQNIAFGATFAILKPRRLPAEPHSTNLATAFVSD